MSVLDRQQSTLLQGLNPQQRKAVTHFTGPLLVLAGAGSGKTRVLTHRIAYLVGAYGVRPEEILAITFTNKAAGEMRERVAALLGTAAQGMWVSTFHAACMRILRPHAVKLGYKPGFTIYDTADQQRLIKSCLERLSIDPKRFPPRSIAAQISDAKNRLQDSESFSEQISSYFDQTVADVYTLYEKRLFSHNAMDFDDLLCRTVNLFELFPSVLERYRNIFTQVLVDEYQDTNRVQYRLIGLLAHKHQNLCVVGDDDQSVYSWRGADIRNILDFEKDFPKAVVIKLEQNYRSTQTILCAANAVVGHNKERKPKALWTQGEDGELITLVQASDEHAEARFVGGELAKLAARGVSADEVAVFYRTNAQSRVLEDIFVRFNIPYQVIGGTRFYERAEIKDALAYLALICNPDNELAFARVINTPKRGVGRTSQAVVQTYAQTVGLSPLGVLSQPEAINGLSAGARGALGAFYQMIETLQNGYESKEVAELLGKVLERSGYRASLQAERTLEARGRLENLDELLGVAKEFDRRDEAGTLSDFLAEVALYSDTDGVSTGEMVTLMTLHSAKGLEYPVVFILGMEEGVFPHSRSIDEQNLEEERRLCYVGITRAMKKLYLTCTATRNLYGARSMNPVSRFIAELPPELVKKVSAGSLGVELGNGRERFQPATGVTYHPGERVVHATFGEGEVLRSQGGRTVTVLFLADRSQRTLLIDYAPLKKLES